MALTFVDFEKMAQFLDSDDPNEVQAAKFVQDLQWLCDEGYVTAEVDADGELRFYPAE